MLRTETPFMLFRDKFVCADSSERYIGSSESTILLLQCLCRYEPAGLWDHICLQTQSVSVCSNQFAIGVSFWPVGYFPILTRLRKMASS